MHLTFRDYRVLLTVHNDSPPPRVKHTPLRDGCCGRGGGRETALCSCLLSCWNFAPSANPFNSRPAVFVWADVQAPTVTSVRSVCANTHVSGYWCYWTVIQCASCWAFGEVLCKMQCELRLLWINMSFTNFILTDLPSQHSISRFLVFVCLLCYSLCWCTHFPVPSLFSQRGTMCAGGLW